MSPIKKKKLNKLRNELDSLDNTEIILSSFNTIDNFLNEEKISYIDFMKIDVQGAEYLVLDGAKESLLKKKIKVIKN